MGHFILLYEILTLFHSDSVSRQIPQFLISTALVCDAWILAESHLCIFPPSSYPPDGAGANFPSLVLPLLSPPSYFKITMSFHFVYLIFYFFADDYECMRCGSPLTPPPKKKSNPFAFELPRSYLNFQFDLGNWLCLSNASLFKFMRSDWGLVCIWSHLCSFLEDELLSRRQ